MHPSEYGPHLDYLKKSAELLVSESPSTSAHLLAVHTQILHNNFRPLNHRHHETFCGACGSIRRPEWTKKTNVSAKSKPQRSNRKVSKEPRDETTVYTCLRCRRRTVKSHRRGITSQSSLSDIKAQTLSQPESTNSPSKMAHDLPQNVSNDREMAQANKASENASSKKRAKTRKQGGLQALLESKQQQKSQSASSSLDIFDFLQQ